jgi:hypothetical protein
MPEGRPNFYELLGLDPSVDDQAEIEKVLEALKRRWNQARTQHTGRKRAEAEANLAWVDEIRRVLGDPSSRRREAEERRRQLAGARDEALAELDRRIGALRSLGGCSPEQLEKLAGQFAGRLGRGEIEQRLRDAGIAIGGSGGGTGVPFVPRPFLSDAQLEEIEHALGTLRFPDLYAFLGASPGTPPEELAAQADQRYRQSLGQVDEQATTVQKLAGIAQTLFRKPDGKARYDASAATAAMRRLHGDIDLMVEGGDLRYEAFDLLARTAADHGVDPELARSYVGWYAEQQGWAIAAPSEQQSPGLDRFVLQMEETLRRVEAEQRQREREWEEERRRMREEARTAGRTPEPPPVAPHPAQSLRAPSSLHVAPIRRGFRLQWPPVPGAGVSYWVVRKLGGYPQDEGDGELCQAVAAPPFEDASAPKGACYYAVFTMRQDQTSADAALSGPHHLRAGSTVRKAAAAAVALTAVGLGAAKLLPPWPWFRSGSNGGQAQPTPSAVRAPVVPPPPPVVVLPGHPPDLPEPKPKPVAALPVNPRVAVLAEGDDQIVPTLEDELIRELHHRGLDTAGRNGLLRFEDHLDRGGRTSIAQLLAGTSLDGVDVLVHADVDRVGERQLQFLGRSETAYRSRVAVQAYLVADQQPLGREWSTEVEYTTVNLAQKLEESIYGMGDEVLGAVAGGWSDYRKRRGAP